MVEDNGQTATERFTDALWAEMAKHSEETRRHLEVSDRIVWTGYWGNLYHAVAAALAAVTPAPGQKDPAP